MAMWKETMKQDQSAEWAVNRLTAPSIKLLFCQVRCFGGFN